MISQGSPEILGKGWTAKKQVRCRTEKYLSDISTSYCSELSYGLSIS